MTINKSQGQSLDYVCLYLSKDVFNHIQLYLEMSRVKNNVDLKILIHDKDNNPLSHTTNVMFKKVFHIFFLIHIFFLFIFISLSIFLLILLFAFLGISPLLLTRWDLLSHFLSYLLYSKNLSLFLPSTFCFRFCLLFKFSKFIINNYILVYVP